MAINLQNILAFVGMILFTVAGNLLLKKGAVVPTGRIIGPLSWISIAGFVFFGAAFYCYSYLLERYPLSLVQCFAAVQFVAVILAAVYFFSESVTYWQWIGIGLISLGMVIVARGL